MAQLRISDKLLKKYPGFTKNELRAVIKIILNSKSSKLRSSHIVRFVVPYLGEFKSHGNKKLRRRKSDRIKDKKKKKRAYDKLLLTKEKLLW